MPLPEFRLKGFKSILIYAWAWWADCISWCRRRRKGGGGRGGTKYFFHNFVLQMEGDRLRVQIQSKDDEAYYQCEAETLGGQTLSAVAYIDVQDA